MSQNLRAETRTFVIGTYENLRHTHPSVWAEVLLISTGAYLGAMNVDRDGVEGMSETLIGLTDGLSTVMEREREGTPQ